MASEIRVNQIQNRSGLGTVTFSDAGLSVSGILTATTFSGNLTGNVTGTVSSSGIATFSNGIIVAAGTTAAPSISPSGDSNTGIFFPSADTVAIAEGGVEALRVDSSSNIGIGTVPKNWSGFRSLQLGGTTSIWSVEGGVSGSSFYSNNIYFDGSNRRYLTTNAASEYIQDASTGNHIFYLASSGSSGNTLSGYSEIARFTSSGLKLPSGLGIDFSANSNATGMTSELLNDYEVGGFTPFFAAGTVSGGYTAQNGTYVKVGRLVTFSLIVDGNGNLQAANQGLQIGGLPFTSQTGVAQLGGAYIVANQAFDISNNRRFWYVSGTNLVYTDVNGTAVNGSAVTDVNKDLYLTGQYFTDS